MLRDELERFLHETFQYEKFQDYCYNGLQIAGKEVIRKIAFGVSFHLPLLEHAIRLEADAIFVHHGIFGKEFFHLKGVMKEKIKLLLQHDISLFGIHLPLDAHEKYGNNAQLFSYIGAEIVAPYDVGFIGKNRQGYSLEQMLDIFHQKLHSADFHDIHVEDMASSILLPKQRHGFAYFANGPAIPENIAILSGGSARQYRLGDLTEQKIDTYICGSVDEVVPAVSYETRTNFVNLGHYWSEKSGVFAVKSLIEQQFGVETVFVDVENVV